MLGSHTLPAGASATPEILRNSGWRGRTRRNNLGGHAPAEMAWRRLGNCSRSASIAKAFDSKGRSMQKRLVTLALAMVLTPALALAQKVSYDYDKTANFAGSRPTPSRTEPRSGSSSSTTASSPQLTRSLRPRASRRPSRTRTCSSFTTSHSTSRRTSRRTARAARATAATVGDTEADGLAARPPRRCVTSWSARSSSISPTPRRRRSSGVEWASRKSTPRPSPRSATRASTAP